MQKGYLPVGSVVLLKGGKDRLMIVGRVVAPNTGKDIYDYAACPYPEGLTGIDHLYCFNDDQIDRLYFIGFQDPEELQLQERLSQLGELYIDENGEIAERTAGEAVDTPEPEPAEDAVEVAHFADV